MQVERLPRDAREAEQERERVARECGEQVSGGEWAGGRRAQGCCEL